AVGAGFPGFGGRLWTIPVAMVIGFVAGRTMGATILGASGAAAAQVYAPTAAGFYTQTFSHIDALEAKGDHRGAVAAWEAVAVSQPRNPWPLLRAGELYLRTLHEPAMALDRFRLARDIEGIAPEHHRYASQKIIDLYLGALRDEGRALVELRRLIDQHPGTREAEGARAALARLKGTP
ncbi:MAG: hypothetical protein HYR75_10175, partial [Gemmatimonadetes bacterium]|nr:hypothetical protein [Gemmatimonadota bacterium]